MLKEKKKKSQMKGEKKAEEMLLISVLGQGSADISKAVYSSVKCFVNCVLNTK